MSDKKTILVVDDDPDIIEQISAILGGQGYTVIAANGEQEGEEALLKDGFDLAILDLMMDQTDSGFMLCHHSKNLYPDIPVILLTAVRSATGISFNSTSAEAGSWIKADKILEKPVRPEQLLSEVRRLLREPIAGAH